MKIIIIGAVAGGTSAAAKARRNDEDAEIKVYDMDYDISYSGCGLPYYIGEEIQNRGDLTPRNTEFFKKKYNVDVFRRHEVLRINAEDRILTIKNLETDDVFDESYDKLVVATGAKPIVPNIEGAEKENVFYLRNVQQADKIKTYILNNKPKFALIVGTGFIGLEMAENLGRLGIEVTLVERLNQVGPGLDSDMSIYVEKYLRSKDINLILGDSAAELRGKNLVGEVVLESGRVLRTDFVIMAIGVKPNVEIAEKAGIELGVRGSIRVDEKMMTNIEYIYACGDCAESFSAINKKPLYRPLGSTANKMGRIAGDQLTGGNLEFRGILGTGIFKAFDMTVAQTGLTEKEAQNEGFDTVVCHNIKMDKPQYYHGKEMIIKAVADRNTGKLLGAQIVGYTGVDKRIDVFVTAISFGAKASDLFHLDLAYAPPFSTTKDPVMYTGMILDNEINRGRKLITVKKLNELKKNEENVTVIDARINKQYEEDHIEGAVNIPHSELRTEIKHLDKNNTFVTYCNKGVTGNAAQNILINNGFKKVYNLSGGYKNYRTQN
ncbi:MAG: FAD-dependent oxidoreductase [Clostridium sp.]|jgi:NADPH-dependent 2,4-dienoyl-CoA reductase/sulfur reductase-like enzyme/rhodanese-related sulfurtransferase|uniref:FAD-dependent oxidoreductase n=1 Tax=Clostridium sp. TaxID=1506 RepID=UPI0025BF373C|nr:FAD-dependent oxidoreductase [Clostridium sp.]MCH3963616.1 FAD-dependent oxidoreductase [Clostridium sp.]MCI1714757.1 FAD-dependent oxidoreductase [Clostridium sp.]MCI1799054.1 FAD-dependent oxidoreductase [Clostridium sp.]MCI1812940.1 FAD-dependent oxidoreductase [Clostridium sp.]MCI1869830.1 FAD-dependent oxidoreductase [Clostridium sp.]